MLIYTQQGHNINFFYIGSIYKIEPAMISWKFKIITFLSITSNCEKIDLSADLDKGISLREATRKITKEVEKKVIKEALGVAKNNKSKAAKILKIDRMTLYSKIKSLGL